MDSTRRADPLRLCPRHRCLLLKRDRYCPWHGAKLLPLCGQVVNSFVINRAISDGSYGVVYMATNVHQPEFVVAMKVLKPPHCYRKRSVNDFLNEAVHSQGIRSINLAEIRSVDSKPWPHITMPLIRGKTLQDHLEERRRKERRPVRAGRLARLWSDGRPPAVSPPPSAQEGNKEGASAGSKRTGRGPPLFAIPEVLDYLIGIARPLAIAHCLPEQRLHRDLKPHNVMLDDEHHGGTPADRVRVIDWGIALKVANVREDARTREEMEKKRKQIVGTLPYMAYECFAGHYSAQSDVYAFGVTAYELLTGDLPFEPPAARTLPAWKEVHEAGPAIAIESRCRGVPRALRNVIRKCLEKDPSQRYTNGAALLRALEGVRAQFDTRTRIRRHVSAAAAIVILVLAYFAFFRSPPLEVEKTGLFAGAPWNRVVQARTVLRFDVRDDAWLREPGVEATRLDLAGARVEEAMFHPREAPAPTRLERAGDGSTILLAPLVNHLAAWVERCRAAALRSDELRIPFQAVISGAGASGGRLDAELLFSWDRSPPEIVSATAAPRPGDPPWASVELEPGATYFLPERLAVRIESQDDGLLEREATLVGGNGGPRRLSPSASGEVGPRKGRTETYELGKEATADWHPEEFGRMLLLVRDRAGNETELGALLFPHLVPRYFQPLPERPLIARNTVTFRFRTLPAEVLRRAGAPVPSAAWFRAEIRERSRSGSPSREPGETIYRLERLECAWEPCGDPGWATLSLGVPLAALGDHDQRDQREVFVHLYMDDGTGIGLPPLLREPFRVPAKAAPRLSDDFEVRVAQGGAVRFHPVRESGSRALFSVIARERPREIELVHKGGASYGIRVADAESGPAPELQDVDPAMEAGAMIRGASGARRLARRRVDRWEPFDDGRERFVHEWRLLTDRDNPYVIEAQVVYDPASPREAPFTVRHGSVEVPLNARTRCAMIRLSGPPSLTFSGNWPEDGERIELDLGAASGSAEHVPGAGAWSVAVPLEAREGWLDFIVRQTDRYGNTGSHRYALVVYEPGSGPVFLDFTRSPVADGTSIRTSEPYGVTVRSDIGLTRVAVTEAGSTYEPVKGELDLAVVTSAPERPKSGHTVSLERHLELPARQRGVSVPVRITAVDAAGRERHVDLFLQDPQGVSHPDVVHHEGIVWVHLSEGFYATRDEVSWEVLARVLEAVNVSALDLGEAARGVLRQLNDPEHMRTHRRAPVTGLSWKDALEIAKTRGWRLMSTDECRAIYERTASHLRSLKPEDILDRIHASENLSGSSPGVLAARLASPNFRCWVDTGFPGGGAGGVPGGGADESGVDRAYLGGLRQFLGNAVELVIDYEAPGASLRDLRMRRGYLAGLKFDDGLTLDPGGRHSLVSENHQLTFENVSYRVREPRDGFDCVTFRFVARAGGEDAGFNEAHTAHQR
jgi:serine/threonine protein kinase